MNKRQATTALCIAILAAAILVFKPLAKGNSWSLKNRESGQRQTEIEPTSPSLQQRDAVPQQVIYGLLFREMAAFRKESAEKGRQGQAQEWLQNYHQQLAGLSESQASVIAQIADTCASEIARLDDEAKQISDAERVRHPHGSLNSEEDLPLPPPRLQILEKQRTEVIMNAREQLRAALGEIEFQRFEAYVQEDVASRIIPIQPGGRLP